MKRKNMKILALLLASVFAVSGCGSNGGNSEGSSSSDGDAPPTESSSSAADDDVSEPAGTEGEDAAETAGGEEIKDLVIWANVAAHDLETLVCQHSEGADTATIGGNCLTPLIELNNHGQMVPAAAKEWGTDDEGLTWTFKLRDDVTYVDVNGNHLGDCTSDDWIVSLEWVLNYWKNQGLNTSMPVSTIDGAGDYYEYTKELGEEAALALDPHSDDCPFLEMVGIEAPDEHTLVYRCFQKCAYFDTLATASCLYPMPQGMIDAVGVKGIVGVSFEDFWYSGPYRLTSWVLNNERILTRNESYWDKDCKLFDTVTVKLITDGLMDDQLWMTGEVDYATLDASTLATILADPSNEWHDYLVQTRPSKYPSIMILNFFKNNPDGTPDDNWNKAVANDAFRLSLYYGLDMTNIFYYNNQVNPMGMENLVYTSANLGVFSSGKDYTARVIELLDNVEENDGTAPRRYHADLAEQYKQQAMTELSEAGVTFPVSVDYYIKAGEQTQLDVANIWKEIFEALGTDYITFNINTYVSDDKQEAMWPQYPSFYLSGWGADFGDVSNFIDQFKYNDDQAIFSVERTNLEDMTDEHIISVWQEYTDMANAAGAITGDMDKRLEAYAQTEAFMLNNALLIPTYTASNWQLTKINDYTKVYSAYGNENIYKNWETSTTPYTSRTISVSKRSTRLKLSK